MPVVLAEPAAHADGTHAQSRALTLLKNSAQTLPLQGQPKIYVKNIDPTVAAGYASVVDTPAAAHFAILRLQTPWVPIETKNWFARNFHHGDLDFKDTALAEILTLLHSVPTIVVLYVDRPAVIPEISQAAHALLADYGASDSAVLDVLFGKVAPQGRLPFELPSSMEAVRKQRSDVPRNSENPLYPFSPFGLSYSPLP